MYNIPTLLSPDEKVSISLAVALLIVVGLKPTKTQHVTDQVWENRSHGYNEIQAFHSTTVVSLIDLY